jgi:hypothetical protein
MGTVDSYRFSKDGGCLLLSEFLTAYLKTVTLSEAKGLACQKESFFAALRMTHYVLR